MKKYSGYISGLLLATMLMPIAAGADTVSDLQNQIQGLLKQIQALEQQIHVAQASSTPPLAVYSTTTPGFVGQGGMSGQVGQPGQPAGQNGGMFCLSLKRNLGVGAKGDDVRQIQNVLASDPSIYTGTTTGYFGQETARAVMKFQSKYGIASSTTGFVGSMTRDFFNKRCQGQVPPPQPMGWANGSTTPTVMPPRPQGDHGEMMGSTTMPYNIVPPRPTMGSGN